MFTAVFPAPPGVAAQFDCTADGKDERGGAVTAIAGLSVPLEQASRVVVPCVQGPKKACLNNGQIEVTGTFVDPSGRRGDATVMSQTPNGVTISFSDPRQGEVYVGAEGCTPNSLWGDFFYVNIRNETPWNYEVSVRNVFQATHSFYGPGPVDDKTTLRCPGK
jgi:hypothetical protein